MRSNKLLKCMMVIVMVVGLLPITKVNAASEFETSVDLACNDLKLNPGQSTSCTVTVSSKGVSFSSLSGEVIVGEGLKVDSISSLNNDYTVTRNGNSFVLADKTVTPGSEDFQKELIEIKLSAQANTRVQKSTIRVKIVKECNSWLKGDLTNDGVVNYLDVEYLRKVFAELLPTTPAVLRAGDLNNDNTITGADILELRANYAVLGDLTQDGKITQADVDAVNQIIARQGSGTSPTENELILGDVNEDGQITSEDATVITGEIGSVNVKEYYCVPVDENRDGATGTIEFQVNSSNGNSNGSDEVVNVPDTASNIPVWYYVVGVIFMAFGVYLIIEARKQNQVQ